MADLPAAVGDQYWIVADRGPPLLDPSCLDMEVTPGAAMTISGPVHTNGNLIARDQTGTTVPIQFTDRASAAGGRRFSTLLIL